MAYTYKSMRESTIYYLIKEARGKYEVVKMSDADHDDIFLDAQDYLAIGMGFMEVLEEMEMAFTSDYVDNPDYDGRIDDMEPILLDYMLKGELDPSYYFVGLQFKDNTEKFKFIGNYDKYKEYFVKWFERNGFLDPMAKNCFNADRVLKKLLKKMPNIDLRKLSEDEDPGSPENVAFIDAYTDTLLEAEENIVVLKQ